jgi:Cu2+-containing amine oxidase
MPRKVDVVLLTDGKSYEALIDLTANKIASYMELKNYQAPMSETEMHSFDDVLKNDPRVVEALTKRGITDSRLVNCYITPAGYVGLPEQVEGRRIGWGGCTYSANAKYNWDREVPGIFFVVDINDKKIVRFSDYGAVPIRRRRRPRSARHAAHPHLAAQRPQLHHQGRRGRVAELEVPLSPRSARRPGREPRHLYG